MLEEMPKEDYFDYRVFEEPAYDCEEDVGVIEDILHHNKNFKYDDNTHADETPYGFKYFNDKKNYSVNGDLKIRKKTYPKKGESNFSLSFVNSFTKQDFINVFKGEIPDTVTDIVKDSSSTLQNLKITFISKTDNNNKIRKLRTK
jgi:hypothetical protein